MRNLDLEFSDNESRKYAYNIDSVIRGHLLARLANHIEVSGDVLEVGAFKGDMTQQILARCPNLSVLEGSPELCAELAKRFGTKISLFCTTVEDANFDIRFDTIFLVHTLEHLDEPVNALRRLSSWLKPGGKLIIAVPNGQALSRQIAVRMGLVESNCAVTPGEFLHGHRRTYDLDTLLRDVRMADLGVLDWGGVVVKALSNDQFDQALMEKIVGLEYIQACDDLARELPHLAATIYVVATSGS